MRPGGLMCRSVSWAISIRRSRGAAGDRGSRSLARRSARRQRFLALTAGLVTFLAAARTGGGGFLAGGLALAAGGFAFATGFGAGLAAAALGLATGTSLGGGAAGLAA